MGDLIDGAIHAAEASVSMVSLEARLPSGRPCMIAVPSDVTTLEALAIVAWVAGALGERTARASVPAASRLYVPRPV